MANPTITALPPIPTRNDAPTAFVDKADAFLGALPGFQVEANALGAAVEADAVQIAADRVQTGLDRASATASASSALNSPGTSGASTTSLLIGAGTKSLTTQAGKAWSVGQGIVIASTASPLNQMSGVMTAYNTATGAMTVEVTAVGGSGTFAAWTISLAAGAAMAVASQAEAEAGTDPSKVMTPLRTAQAAAAKLSSQADAEAGVDNAKSMTPLRTAQAVAALAGSVGDIVFSTGVHDGKWLRADGSIVLKSTYPALASVLGLTPNNLTNAWPGAPSGLSSYVLGNLAYGAGRWVVVNGNGAASVSTNDCVSWINNSGPGVNYAGSGGAATSTGGLMAYGAGLFVVFNVSNGNRSTSPDGVGWTARNGGLNPNVAGQGGYLQGVTFGNGLFVVWGYYYTAANVYNGDTIESSNVSVPFIFTSPDALTWTRRVLTGGWSLQGQYYYSATDARIQTITYGDGVFLAVGSRPTSGSAAGYSGIIQTSTDGVTWVERINPAYTAGVSSCAGAIGGGVAIVIFNGSAYRSINSGVNWTPVGPISLTGSNILIYTLGSFIAFGASNQIYTSMDGILWVDRGVNPTGSYGYGCIATNQNSGIVCVGTGSGYYMIYLNIFTYNVSTQFIIPSISNLTVSTSRVPASAYIKAL